MDNNTKAHVLLKLGQAEVALAQQVAVIEELVMMLDTDDLDDNQFLATVEGMEAATHDYLDGLAGLAEQSGRVSDHEKPLAWEHTCLYGGGIRLGLDRTANDPSEVLVVMRSRRASYVVRLPFAELRDALDNVEKGYVARPREASSKDRNESLEKRVEEIEGAIRGGSGTWLRLEERVAALQETERDGFVSIQGVLDKHSQDIGRVAREVAELGRRIYRQGDRIAEVREQSDFNDKSLTDRVQGLETDMAALRRGEATIGEELRQALERVVNLEKVAHEPVDLRPVMREVVLEREREIESAAGSTLAVEPLATVVGEYADDDKAAACGQPFIVQGQTRPGDSEPTFVVCNDAEGHLGPHSVREAK